MTATIVNYCVVVGDIKDKIAVKFSVCACSASFMSVF